MFKMENVQSFSYKLIILTFILYIIPLFNCGVEEKRETYFTCKENKVEKITQNQPRFTSDKVSNTKQKGNLETNNVQDISSLLLMGIQHTINTFNFNSESDTPIYFEKTLKYFNADLSTKGVTFKAIFPEHFLSLRMLYNTAQDFNESFTSSSLFYDHNHENKKSTKIFYTSDYKYAIEIINKKQQETLCSILFDSFSHFCTFPNSLLPKYSGLYYIKQKFMEYYFLISRNIKDLTINTNRFRQYFLNGSNGTALKTNKMQIINFQLLDNNFIKRYPEGLKIPSHEQKILIKILENDTKFLSKLNMICYNLVLIFCVSFNNGNEVEGSSRTISEHNKNIQFNDKSKKIVVYYGIVDTLHTNDLKKKIQSTFGCTCVLDDIVKDPTKYQKRFMHFITSKVFKSD